MTPKEGFGQYVRQLREEKRKTDPNFSLRGFAKALNLSPTFLSKVENDEFNPPSAENIRKMAELLGVDPDELLARAEKVSPDIPGIIHKNPVTADLLRTVRDAGLTSDQIVKLTEQIREQGKKKK